MTPEEIARLLKSLEYPRSEVIAALVTECGLPRSNATTLYDSLP